MTNRTINYIRVSTARQGRSGLGIEAQRQALQQFAKAEGLELLASSLRLRPARAQMPSTADRSSRLLSRLPRGSSAT